MDKDQIITEFKKREDLKAVVITEGSVYAWLNKSIGHTGDFNPGLLNLLVAIASAGHGVFLPAWSAPVQDKHDDEPDIQVAIDWRD